MNFKTVITLFSLILMAQPITAFASNDLNDSIKINTVKEDVYDNKNYNAESYFEFIVPELPEAITAEAEITAMSQEEIDKKVNSFTKEFNNKLDKDIRDKGEKDLNTYRIDNNSAQGIAANDDHDKYYNELRKGNFIEGILDIEEGLSNSQIAKIGVTHANTARSAALKRYPNNLMLADGFRHFTWNYLAARDVGAVATRTATINHEWGILLLTPATNYYSERYNYYKGKNNNAPGNAALIDTTAYLPELKQNLVLLSKNDYSFFKGYFKKSNIMDLHNNCYGRSYAASNKPDGFDKVYSMAREKQQIILSEASVTDHNYQYVWKNNWYTY
ncbi:hypothetical protein PQ460_00955 [Paenibacillus sp. KACC 21273]|uniref:hypothetical protein n=1 Tax=Paenibacillus sp. KACC 21273 TaxID=3025665 RepID=UPI002366852D|nr:hypothetical protein [Paenibacillus sp. KACC 21273]WDF51052.1 hypothetical protein PQ460_00955 [Paenibacillus sp. KACC 21273]